MTQEKREENEEEFCQDVLSFPCKDYTLMMPVMEAIMNNSFPEKHFTWSLSPEAWLWL